MTMSGKRAIATAEAYYKALIEGDVDAVAAHLHPDVRFLGPLGNRSGKEPYLEAVKGFADNIQDFHHRASFGTKDSAMLIYVTDFGNPIGIVQTAVLMNFIDGLIARTELFQGAASVEKSA